MDSIEESKQIINQFIDHRAKEANDKIAEMCDYLRFGKKWTMKDPKTGVLLDFQMKKDGSNHTIIFGVDYPTHPPINHSR